MSFLLFERYCSLRGVEKRKDPVWALQQPVQEHLVHHGIRKCALLGIKIAHSIVHLDVLYMQELLPLVASFHFSIAVCKSFCKSFDLCFDDDERLFI